MSSEALYLQVDARQFQEFALKFARFEYALKAAGFWKAGSQSNAEKYRPAVPDWRRFASSIAKAFQSNRTPELLEAYQYLVTNSPDREVVTPGPNGGEFVWEPQEAPSKPSEAEGVLEVIQWVRNHLIHG